MKKKLFLLLLPLLTLSSCDLSNFIVIKSNDNVNENQNDQKDSNNTNNENISVNNSSGDNTQGDTQNNTDNDGQSHSQDNNNEHNDNDDQNQNIPVNSPLFLEEYTYFSFHEGREPSYESYWNFYYGTSHNPNGLLWENPNEKSECSGVEFKKNVYAVSPTFNNWKKIEIRLDFWCSSHQSSNYKAKDNEPQLYIEQYNSTGTLLYKDGVDIKRSDVPSNNTTIQIKKYLDEDTCSYFIVRWNNYIPNGDSGYSMILCDAMLKGWPYDA